MNTIKIYLDQSGELADLQKDFPLYQFQFNNKLLNIYIPRVLLGASAFIDDNINSGNACLVKMSYTMDWNGKTKTSDAFICRYVKDVTQNGITYSLFERTLPYAFTLYAGQGAGAPQLTVMACNVVEGSVVSTISAQPVALDVLESSTIFDIDDIPPSTALTELESQLNSVIADLALKQNKDDPEINPATDDPDTNDHTVAGNINTLLNDYKDINEFVRGDDGLAEQVADNTQDIENLKTFLTIGLNIVGTYEITSTSVEDNNQPPTPEELTTFIEGITGLDHLERGDACFVYWNNYQADDTQALYYWNGTVFNSLQMSPVHNAQNDIAGLIEGTYTLDGLSTPNTLMVDIQNGHIANIYRVDSNGNYIDLKSAMDQVIAKLVGNVPVNRATADKNGNDITTKYMTKGTALDDGASHRYVQEYASPRALYDLNYPDYALGQFKSVEVSDTSYNKTTTSPNAETQNLYTPLATLTKTLEADILLGDQNGLINRIWITANITEDVKLRIETSYIDGNNQTQILSIEETDTFGLVNGIAKLLQIESVFSGLTQPITLPAGTTLIQTIEVHRQVSTSANFTLLSNTTYNAYMTLNKIGYVRYALEQEPNAIETAADSSYINADGDLEVVGDGTIHYANGDSAPLTTIVKLPIDTTPTQNSTKPITSGGVKTYVDNAISDKIKVVDISTWEINTQLTAEHLAILSATPTPTLKKGNLILTPTSISPSQKVWVGIVGDVKYTYSVVSNIGGLSNEYLTRNSNIANDYSSSSTYAVGDYVFYGNILYRCTTAITTAESWNSAHWTQATATTDIEDNATNINNLQSDVAQRFKVYNLDAGLLGTNVSNAIKTLLTTNPRPIIFYDNQYYYPSSGSGVLFYWDLDNADPSTGVLKTIYLNGNELGTTTSQYPTTAQLNAKASQQYVDGNFASNSVAGEEYDPTRTYNKYDTCRHNGKAYYRSSSTPATGTWNATGWTEFNMGQLFGVTRDLDNTKYEKPSGGIPKTDLASAVQTSLGKADTAVQPSALLNLIYPVGSIYTSANNTSPATLFGGTWTALNSGNTIKLPTGDLNVNTKSSTHSILGDYSLKWVDSNSGVQKNNGALSLYEGGTANYNQYPSGSAESRLAPANLYATMEANTISVYMWQRTS